MTIRCLAVLAATVLATVLSSAAVTTSSPIRDKTLVAWVIPANLQQQGSGVVSMMHGDRFDAIVLGEIERGRWMAGSDYFRRTHKQQSDWPAETAGQRDLVHVAIVYKGHRITIYRNGEPYADHDALGQQTFDGHDDVLIGARYLAGPGTETGFFAGEIDEVRIYDRALTPQEVLAMLPGHAGEPAPRGMWTFDSGTAEDEMGNYPLGHLQSGASIAEGRLQLDGRGQYVLITHRPVIRYERVQDGFFTPRRVGMMWDTWLYYHDGTYYQFYLAGSAGHWDGHELAISRDGVHWSQHGVVIKPREEVTWMGTGHIWKSPDFETSRRWVMNYSEWLGPKQDIMFATSTDLRNWTKVDERQRFVQDTRWYQPRGRWDCIDTLPREDGGLYGYFTADPVRDRVDYPCCGFGMAESRDGITWTALPPPPGDIAGELGGIQKIGNRYYLLVSEGRVAVGEQPEGPFLRQKTNYHAFGEGSDIYFPRFFHNAPGGPLVNHFYTRGTVCSAPLKAIEVDAEGVLRLKWWQGNDRLKSEQLPVRLVAGGNGFSPDIRLFGKQLDLSRTHILEAEVRLSQGARPGIYFDHGDDEGDCLLLEPRTVSFGQIGEDGTNLRVLQTLDRGIDFGDTADVRVVIKHDMMEFYVNDHLMNLKRIRCNGRVGLIGTQENAIGDIRMWCSRPPAEIPSEASKGR